MGGWLRMVWHDLTGFLWVWRHRGWFLAWRWYRWLPSYGMMSVIYPLRDKMNAAMLNAQEKFYAALAQSRQQEPPA